MSKTKTYPLRLPRSLKEAVERLSKEDGTSINQFVATAVAEFQRALDEIAQLPDTINTVVEINSGKLRIYQLPKIGWRSQNRFHLANLKKVLCDSSQPARLANHLRD